MAQTTVDWFNEGKGFEPIVFIGDVEAYEEADKVARTPGTNSVRAVLAAKLSFLEKVLPRTAPLPKRELNVIELGQAFQQVWLAGQSWLPEATLPLGSGGQSGAPS